MTGASRGRTGSGLSAPAIAIAGTADRAGSPRMLVGTLPKLAANVVSILSSDVMNRATTFILYALVARSLGAFEFGQMSLALTLFYTFQVLAAGGLRTFITRQVAEDRAQTGLYLLNGSIVAAAFAIMATIGLVVFTYAMGYAPETASVILLLSLGLLPYALTSVCEAVFQAWERMYYIAYANLPVNLARIGLGALFLNQGYGLPALIALLMLSQAALLAIEWALVWRCIERPALKLDIPFSRKLVRSTTTFLGIDVLIAVTASLNIILLSKLASESEVGLYGAAVQLLTPIMLVVQSVVVGVFPLMCRHPDPRAEDLKQITEDAAAALMAVVLPLVIGLFFLAEPVLLLLYAHRDFVQSSELLRVAVWALIPTALMCVFGNVLMAIHRERFTLGLVAAHTVANLVVGLILIKQLGALGAVILVLIDKLAGCLIHYVLVWRLLTRVMVVGAVWRPAVAGACLAACLAIVNDRGPLVSVVVGGLVYSTVLLALTLWSAGGPNQLWARYARVRPG